MKTTVSLSILLSEGCRDEPILKKTDIFAKTAKLLITVVITASDPTGLTAAGATLDAYLHIFDQHSQNNPDLKKLQKEFAKTLKTRFEDRDFHFPKGADVLLPQMVEAAVVAHDDFTTANLDPDKIIELLIGRLTDSEHKAPDMLAAFRKLYSPAMSSLLSDPRLISAIQPAIQRKQLEQGDRIEAKLDNAAMLPRDQLELLASRFKHPDPHDASDADLVTYLGNMATQYRSLITRVQNLEQKYPQLGNVAAIALELLQNGDTSAVHKMIRDARELLRDAHLLEGLEQDAELVQVDAQALIFDGEIQQAYDILAAAADSFASVDRLEPSRRRGAYGNMLYDYGLRFAGDALELAAQMWGKAVEDVDRAKGADLWAGLQTNLGNALQTLGQREVGTTRLEQAVEVYRNALTAFTQDRVPLQWASTQNNLGNALTILGQRESDTGRLEAAVRAYHHALTERTQDKMPLQWAATQNNLGNALSTLGQRESGTARLEAAVQAFHSALTERTQDKVPLDWAMTQNNLGTALHALGQRESGTARLEAAVQAYHSALTEQTQDKVPLDWAMTQNNLGNALRTLGQRESGTARLEAAVQAYHKALTERTQDKVPLDWAVTQNNLGNALTTLGERENGTARLEQAVQAFHNALTEWTQGKVPLQWAISQGNLGGVYIIFFDKTDDHAHLETAESHVQAALAVFEQSAPHYAGMAQEQLQQIAEQRARR